MMIDKAFDDWFANRRGEVHVLNSEVAGARIINAWLESGRRQLDKRNMLAHRDRLRHRRHRSHEQAGFAFGGERQRGLAFSVLWKVFGVGKIKSAACRIKTELTLLIALQRTRDSVNV